jgi:hypothetical protein
MSIPGDPQGVQESYPTPTSGLSKAVEVRLSATPSANQSFTQYVVASGPAGGSGSAGGNEYDLYLSLSQAPTITLTASILDVDGNSVTPVNTAVWKSYSSHPNAADFATKNPNDVQESYPPKPSGQIADIADVSSTGQLTGLVTAKSVGKCSLNCQFPFGDNNIGNDATTGQPIQMVYATIHVRVQV